MFGELQATCTNTRKSGRSTGDVAMWQEPVSVKVLRIAATCCFWQQCHKEAAQHLKQRGDLKLLTETVATDLGSQTPAPFPRVRNLSGPPQCWLLKATRCWMQARVRRSMTQLEVVFCGLAPRLLQCDVRGTSTFMRPYVRVHIRG